MIHFGRPNCVHADNHRNCRHATHRRKSWFLRLILGDRPECVLETAHYFITRDGEVICNEQEKLPRPRPPNPPRLNGVNQ